MEYLIEDLKASFHLKTGNKRTLLNNAPCAAVAAPPPPMSLVPGLVWGCQPLSMGEDQPPLSLQGRYIPPLQGWKGGKGVGCAWSQAPWTPLTGTAWHRVSGGGTDSPASSLAVEQSPDVPKCPFSHRHEWQNLRGLLGTGDGSCVPGSLYTFQCGRAFFYQPPPALSCSWSGDGAQLVAAGVPLWGIPAGNRLVPLGVGGQSLLPWAASC